MSDALAFDQDFDAPAGAVRDAEPPGSARAGRQSEPVHVQGHLQLHRRPRTGRRSSIPDRTCRRMSRRCSTPCAGETVTHIVVSHTHRDHSPAAARRPGRHRGLDRRLRPASRGARPRRRRDRPSRGKRRSRLCAGYRAEGGRRRIRAGLDPSGGRDARPHREPPVLRACREENALFSADHVMAWSTSVVAPPDGSMSAYMASLDKLRGRDERIYWPGHGGPGARSGSATLRALIHHRRQREASILARLAAGDRTVPAIVAAIYQGLSPALVGAAALSVFAHLEDLVARGIVATDGPARPGRRISPRLRLPGRPPTARRWRGSRPPRGSAGCAGRSGRDRACRCARPSARRCGRRRRAGGCAR